MNSFVYATCVGVFASLFAGCLPNESMPLDVGQGGESGSPSTGSARPAIGKSRAIQAFQAARKIAQRDPDALAVIELQTARTNMVDISPEAEDMRVALVLDWTVDEYEQAMAQLAGLDFDRGLGPRLQAEAELASARFEEAAMFKYNSLPEQPWDAEWLTYANQFMESHAAISGPDEWDNTVYRSRSGALMCMKILAAQAGAATMQEALVALEGVRALMFKRESAMLRQLETTTGKY